MLPPSMKVLSTTILCIAGDCLGRAGEWTGFRGENGAGISRTKWIPSEISDSDINWKLELPGSGHSSPVLRGERIFLTTTR